jgi:acid phosphatase
MYMRHARLAIALAFAIACVPTGARAADGLERISHILVVYLENRSFDNLFGEFPGANGLSTPGAAVIQRDRDDKPYDPLPAPDGPFKVHNFENPESVQKLTLEGLDNRPFAIDGVHPGVTVATFTRDLVHRFYTHRSQIHGGANDRFVAYSDAKGLAMGHYSKAGMEGTTLWRLAKDNVLLDNFFQGAFGGSFLNHIWFVCGCAPVWPQAPAGQRSELDAAGNPVSQQKDARVTAVADGDYAVNTTQSVFLNDGRQGANLLPPQRAATIGDRLTDKGIDWAWYSGGWNLAITPNRKPQEEAMLTDVVRFQWHHQPLAYFARFDPATQHGRGERRQHLRDASDLDSDIRTGQLPPVAFYKPSGILNQHPGYSGILESDGELRRIVTMMNESPMKGSYAIVVTYDEFGGFFDHVAPPAGAAAGGRADFFGPGSRIPTLVISPFVKHGTIDSTSYDTTSILKLIADRFALDPLPSPRFQAVESLARLFR